MNINMEGGVGVAGVRGGKRGHIPRLFLYAELSYAPQA